MRPAKPDWMDQATYDRMPASIELREVETTIDLPGFRSDSLVIVTTLNDATVYSGEELSELYRRRWQAELDIRTIKITMGMDVLRCESPHMVKREIWTCLLAYNLIRQTMLASASVSGRAPRELSFTAALQTIAAGWVAVLFLNNEQLQRLIERDHEELKSPRVGHRPNRVEPRAIKRRPKPHKLLTETRDEARSRLLAGKA